MCYDRLLSTKSIMKHSKECNYIDETVGIMW